MKNIVLVGFMGTGKTEVSKILAQRLKRPRFCTDDMIEFKAGEKIAKIFELEGEVYFRRLEADVIKAVSKDKNIIIDAGGGVVIDEHNVRHLKEHGVVFCLTARPEVILERTKAYTHRPILNAEDPYAKINELLGTRAEYYKRADYSIDTSDMTPDQVADKVLETMEGHEAAKKHSLIFTA